jgi:PAS domain S-box-containing protein
VQRAKYLYIVALIRGIIRLVKDTQLRHSGVRNEIVSSTGAFMTLQDYKIILIGIGFAFLLWILESAIHVIFLGEGTFIQQLVSPDSHELWMRTLTFAIIILFSIYAQILFNREKDAENELEKHRDHLQELVTERTSELKENEARFKAIFEGSNDAIMLLTAEGFFDCNPSALKIFGLKTKEEFVKFHPAQLSPPTQPDGHSSDQAASEHIQTAFRTGYDRFDWVHRRSSGEDFPAEVVLSAFEWGKKRVLQATVRDISERVQSEKALKESYDQFHLFIREAAMRLKNPLEVVEGNIAFIVRDIEAGESVATDVSLQLKIQIKDLEQIRQNIIQLNKTIVDRSGEFQEASLKFLTE